MVGFGSNFGAYQNETFNETHPPPFTRLTALMLLAALAGPVWAQVDQTVLGGVTGPDACPTGITQQRSTILRAGNLTKDAAQISYSQLTLSALNSYYSRSSASTTVFIQLHENGVSRKGNGLLDSVTSSEPLPAGSRAFRGLKQNTRYTASLHRGTLAPFARICFRTAADLEIPFGSGRGGDGPGDSWSSGCYAFSKDRNQILACFCGARNSSGQWRWNDGDGYEYMMDAAWRNRVGCTTN